MSNDVKMELDTRELREALRLYQKATQKDEAEIINKAALNVCIGGAFQNTPKADSKEIERDFYAWGVGEFAIKIAALQLKGNRPRTTGVAKIPWKKGAKGAQKWQKACGKQAKAILRHRKIHVSFMRSSWVRLGGFFGGKRRPPKKFQGQDVAAGRKATVQRRVADLENKVAGRIKGGRAILQRAVNGAARDMGEYARRKMEKTARKYSAK